MHAWPATPPASSRQAEPRHSTIHIDGLPQFVLRTSTLLSIYILMGHGACLQVTRTCEALRKAQFHCKSLTTDMAVHARMISTPSVAGQCRLPLLAAPAVA